jgi:hypothetical protein
VQSILICENAPRTLAQIEALVAAGTPVLLKGFIDDWPIVQTVKTSGDAAGLDYLASFYNGQPVLGFYADDIQDGRIFYDQSMTQYNFVKQKVDLAEHINTLKPGDANKKEQIRYVGSTATDRWLPGFEALHDMPIDADNCVSSLWLGNACTVPAHFDVPQNIACCILGRRRFTLFPPEQVANLYIGPIELTPAGQTVSCVDIRNPDYDRFPRYREAEQHALIADMEPGDALFLPSMWWHNVESLAPANGLVNYWWRAEPAYLGPPAAALNHAMMSIKSLPKQQRDAWRALFEYYVFDGDQCANHLPLEAAGRLSGIDERTARQLRAELMNALK